MAEKIILEEEQDKAINGRVQPKGHGLQKGAETIADWKEPLIKATAQDIDKFNTIAVINMQGLPSKQLQKIRAKIKDQMTIRMSRKRILRRALKKSSKKEVQQLADHMEGMSALLLTDLDAFALFQILKSNISTAPAKPGQLAPFDLIIPKGPTQFGPGPILSELAGAGLPVAIENGKIALKKETTLVKAGEAVSTEAATVLTRLGIEPMKIGIDLIAALEGTNLFIKDLLDFNEEEYIQKIREAYQNAFNLAYAQSISTCKTAELLIKKAHLEAKQLALTQGIITDKTRELVLAKAVSGAKALKNNLPEAAEKSQSQDEVKPEESGNEEASKDQSSEENTQTEE